MAVRASLHADNKQPDARPKTRECSRCYSNCATITSLLKNGLNHSIWLPNLISYPKPTQYKHITMTTIFHPVFQFQFQNDIAAEYQISCGKWEF